jgi:hypothetical protein
MRIVVHSATAAGACARALERDLAEVQVARREVGVRRVVPVEPADDGITEQHAAAAVGLEAVLVRIDHDGIASPMRSKAAGVRVEVVREREVAAVGRVDVQAEGMALAQRDDPGQRIDGARRRRAERRDHGADAAVGERLLERGNVHAAARVHGHLAEGHAKNCAQARVRVVRLCGCRDCGARRSSRAIHSASKLAIVPPLVRWPRCVRQPYIAAICATASFSIAELARPPSSA